jgi:hypothetical protein
MPELIFGNLGDYEHSDRHLFLINARIAFIDAISRCAPEVFEALHAEPLNTYKMSGMLSTNTMLRAAFWREYIGIDDPDYYFDMGVPGTDSSKQRILSRGGKANLKCDANSANYFGRNGFDPQVQSKFCEEDFPKIRVWFDSLSAWASAYHLRCGWMLHWAFLKLDSYADNGANANSPPPTYRLFNLSDIFGRDVQPKYTNPYGIYDYGVDMECEPFTFSFRGWRPTLQSAKTYSEAARKKFDQVLKEYVGKAVLGMQHSPDVSDVRVKRKPEHFDWLVCRQVYGMTADAIMEWWWKESDDDEEQARRQELTTQAVNKAVKETAKLIDITPRRVGRGPQK